MDSQCMLTILSTIEGRRDHCTHERQKDEKFVTLDGQERTMDDTVLMICDGEKACRHGRYHGRRKFHDHRQCYRPCFLRRHALTEQISVCPLRRSDLRTDASGKFEKGLDPNNAQAAIDRACQLMEELGAGEVVGGMVDVCQ